MSASLVGSEMCIRDRVLPPSWPSMPHVQRPAARCLGAKTAADSPSHRLFRSVARPLTVAT
eukprot:1718503-Alexandrium_andersonii.AAC.1